MPAYLRLRLGPFRYYERLGRTQAQKRAAARNRAGKQRLKELRRLPDSGCVDGLTYNPDGTASLRLTNTDHGVLQVTLPGSQLPQHPNGRPLMDGDWPAYTIKHGTVTHLYLNA